MLVVNRGFHFHRVPCLRLAEPQQRGPMAAGAGGWRKYSKTQTAAAAAAVCEPEQKRRNAAVSRWSIARQQPITKPTLCGLILLILAPLLLLLLGKRINKRALAISPQLRSSTTEGKTCKGRSERGFAGGRRRRGEDKGEKRSPTLVHKAAILNPLTGAV